MWRQKVETIEQWIWAIPSGTEKKGASLLRALLRIVYITLREFRQDQIPLRASSLTFTVILSLVPMLALGSAALKGFGAGDEMQRAAHLMVERFTAPEQYSVSSPPPEEPADREVQTTPPPEDSLSAHLHLAVDKMFDYVNRTNFATLGAFGIFGLLIAVIFMLNNIELAMNSIWQARSSRSLGRKLVDYLALIILLPVSANLAFTIEAAIQSPTLLSLMKKYLPISGVDSYFVTLLPLLIVMATFTLLYRFLPNAKVPFFPALTGGFFGALGWLLAQSVYVELQLGVARYNAIYGSFATLPLLLLWIYTAWVVFLGGAEMAFAVQIWRHYILGKAVLNPAQKLSLVFDILETAALDFSQRKLTSISEIAHRLRLPDPHVKAALDDLVDKGILRRVKNRETGYVPATPVGKIHPEEVVALILGESDTDTHGATLTAAAVVGARKAMTGKTLKIKE
ncbi:YihY/virulence factor BrkB family protein [Thermodesulfobacteriota bacterium]